MCLLVPRCGPRKSMRVILGILKVSGSGVESKRRPRRLLGPGSLFGEARGLLKEAGLGCACCRALVIEDLVIT
jgi:hypothetical protein